MKKPHDIDLRRELRRKILCFTFQESWAPGHICATGTTHYIEFFSDLRRKMKVMNLGRVTMLMMMRKIKYHPEMGREPFLQQVGFFPL